MVFTQEQAPFSCPAFDSTSPLHLDRSAGIFFPHFVPETYCISNTLCSKKRICFINTSSYLLPSTDLQILYYVPHSYSVFGDSSSCVGQMAQSVGCIRALKKKFFLAASTQTVLNSVRCNSCNTVFQRQLRTWWWEGCFIWKSKNTSKKWH